VIRIGAYYIRVEGEPDCDGEPPVGAVVMVADIDEDGDVHVPFGDHNFTYKVAEFEQDFKLDKKGMEKTQQRIAGLIADVHNINLEMQKELTTAKTAEERVTENALVQADARAPARAKKEIAFVRNRARKLRYNLRDKKEELKQLLEGQTSLMEAAVGKLEGFLKKAEEAIWTINLYLGKDETIEILRKGKPAPADELIVIRQQVLYADEESAAKAAEGGIGFEDMEEFDEWLFKPENLNQVLPETKGVVAIRARHERRQRSSSGFSSALRHADEDKWDLKTQFLFRNGECLYRVIPNIEVGNHLFPRHDEFDGYFIESNYDFKDRKYKERRIKPGSYDFDRAMKKCDSGRRHYLRILLFLQGVLDRTPIFQPIEGEYVNVCDPKGCEDVLRFIRDAELVLETGRKPFFEWLGDTNRDTGVGHRIMGAFDTSYVRQHEPVKIEPKGAYSPESLELYTVERADDVWISFLYKRPKDWREYEKRARCYIDRGAKCFLNFDRAHVADMEYYMGSRVNRHEYITLFPLLTMAIELKRAEQEEEAPFRNLLVTQIVKANKIEKEKAESILDDLIIWWKFKNHVHRALKADDAKALRMIVAESKVKLQRMEERAAVEALHNDIIKALQAEVPNAIFIGHKRGHEYVVIASHNDENIFVSESVWRIKAPKSDASRRLAKRFGKGLRPKLLAEKPWTVVDGRRYKWEKLWADARWDAWTYDVRTNKYLTDPEKAQIAKEARTYAEEYMAGKHKRSQVKKGKTPFLYLATTLRDNRVEAVVSIAPPYLPTDKRMSGNERGTRLETIPFYWEKKRGAVDLEASNKWYRDNTTVTAKHDFEWENGELLESCPENIAKVVQEYKEYTEFHRENQLLHGLSWSLYDEAHAACVMLAKQRAHDEYLEDHGDPDLWEEYWEEIKKDNQVGWPKQVERAADCYIAARYDIKDGKLWCKPKDDLDGKTIGWLMKEAKKHGFKGTKKRDNFSDDDIPMDYAFELEVEEEEEEDDEDDLIEEASLPLELEEVE
jgi:hypothetical protein